MKILACQISADGVITRRDMEAHQDRVAQVIRSACETQTVDLIFLPELSAIEYSVRAFENLATLSSPTDGWACVAMAELASELSTPICFGMPRVENDKYHISQIVIGPDGKLVTDYDKLHIAQFGDAYEKQYFSPGNSVSVFGLNDFRFGLVICYDMRFGDYISTLVRNHQLDAMLHPVAFSTDGSFASWRSFVCTRALENQIYWLSLNRAGLGWGQSVFCPPWFEDESEVVQLGENESLRVIELDKAKLHSAVEKYPIKKDRRSDYVELSGDFMTSKSS
ncbi:MAG: carbon-nitrogen hydrolase family protein [Pseudomonadota bacterium]